MKKKFIKKGLVIGIVMLFFISTIPMINAEHTGKKQNNLTMFPKDEMTVWVNNDYNPSTPDIGETNFSTINDAILHIKQNETCDTGYIYVRNGTYNEEVVITGKEIHLIAVDEDVGDDINTTIYSSSAPIVIIGKSTSGSEIDGFYITGSSCAGILVLDSETIDIHNNAISSNKIGIYFISSKENCKINNNIITENKFGIFIESSRKFQIEGNHVINNNLSGIEIFTSSLIIVDSNEIAYNGHYNIWVERMDENNLEDKNEFYENNIRENDGRFFHLRFNDALVEWDDNYWEGRDYIHPLDRHIIIGKTVFLSVFAIYSIQFDKSPRDVEKVIPYPNIH